MNNKLDLFSICVDIRNGLPCEVSFQNLVKIFYQAIFDKNYFELQFVLEILLRSFQIQTLDSSILNDLFIFCRKTLSEYESEALLNSKDYNKNERLNLLKNTIIGTVDLAYYLKIRIPDKLSKSISLIEDDGVKYSLSKYKNLKLS